MKQKNKNSVFTDFMKVLESNGYSLKRRGTNSFIYQNGETVIVLPRSVSMKDIKTLSRRYNLV